MAIDTIGDAIDSGSPARIAAAFEKYQLGTALKTPAVYHPTALSAAVTLTLDPPALFVQAVTVVEADAGYECCYMVADAGATPKAPVGGDNLTPGICALSADGTTLTFHASSAIVEAVVSYIPRASAAE